MQVAEFVAAEHSTNPVPGVWVLLTTYSAPLSTGVHPVRFEITTSTGYRAALPACLSDLCVRADVPLISCTRPLSGNGQHAGQSVDAWCRHLRTHCHEWHLPRAEMLAADVAKTYGSAMRACTPAPARRRSLGPKMSAAEWSAARGETDWQTC